MEAKSLTGQVAVVTGASSGIGAAIAVSLAKAGARVAMGARRVEQLEDLKQTIEKNGGEALYVKTDVSKREQVKALVKKAEEMFGPVDILVNNAAAVYYQLMKNLHEDKWEQMVDVNCKGMLNGIGAVLGGMTSRQKGHIVNVSSDNGRMSTPALAVYSGTKFFMEGVSRALRQEVCKLGVKVTIIQPGEVDTGAFNPTMFSDLEAVEKYGTFPGDYKILASEDIANAVLNAVTQPSHVAVNEVMVHPTVAAPPM